MSSELLTATASALKRAFIQERNRVTGNRNKTVGPRYTAHEMWNRGARLCESVLADPYEFAHILIDATARNGKSPSIFPDAVIGKNAARRYLALKGYADVPMMEFDSEGALLPHYTSNLESATRKADVATDFGSEEDWNNLVIYQLRNANSYLRRATKMYPEKNLTEIILESAAFVIADHVKFIVGISQPGVLAATRDKAREYFVQYPQYLRSMERTGMFNDVRLIRFILNLKG